MVRYLFYTIGDLTYQSPLVRILRLTKHLSAKNPNEMWAQGSLRDYDYMIEFILLRSRNKILIRK